MIKFLPFDENDLAKLDKLIRMEEAFTHSDKRARWRAKDRENQKAKRHAKALEKLRQTCP